MNYSDTTQAAYDDVVDLYASMFDNELEDQPFTRSMLDVFAELVLKSGNRNVADVGCGPGHIAALLYKLGLDAHGFDISPAMIEYAKKAHLGPKFTTAQMEALPVETGMLGGIVAHYSMIHTPPKELPALLKEQTRVLASGGLFMVSFFANAGSDVVPFDHKVTPAYSWPVNKLASLLTEAGFDVFARLVDDPKSDRGFLDAHILARLQQPLLRDRTRTKIYRGDNLHTVRKYF